MYRKSVPWEGKQPVDSSGSNLVELDPIVYWSQFGTGCWRWAWWCQRISSGGGGSIAVDEGKRKWSKGCVSYSELEHIETLIAAVVAQFWRITIATKILSDVELFLVLTDAQSKCQNLWSWFIRIAYLCDTLMVPKSWWMFRFLVVRRTLLKKWTLSPKTGVAGERQTFTV